MEASIPARQRSLRAAMDWSLGLLPEPVLRLHRRAAVIAGSFAPSTAASILERGERRGILPLGIDVADGLRQLADASLLRTNAAAGEYELLSTVRADALDRLASSGEEIAMRWAHAYEVLALVEEAEKDFPTERETDALDRLDTAHNDIREALEWAMDQGDSTFALRLAGRWPSSGGLAATTPRAGCASLPHSRSATTRRRPCAARPSAARGCSRPTRATTASPSRISARRSRWRSPTATTRRAR